MAERPADTFLNRPEKIYPESTAFGWKDITAQINVRGAGANDPGWAQIGAGPFFAYDFALNDQCWVAYHTPHDIVPGKPIHFHAHWFVDGTNVQPVRWEWSYMFAKGFQQQNYAVAGTVITADGTPPGTAYHHMTTETAAVTIADLTEPDGIIYARLRRIANGGTDNTDGVFLLEADVHYQTTQKATYGKAPNFYQA